MTAEMESAMDVTSKTLWSALGVLLLTTVHHVYGAFVYNTPWCHHVAIVSTLTAAVIIGCHVLQRRTNRLVGRIAFWVFAVVTLAIHVVTIGLFEGGYNHVVKDALYLKGASPELMQRLFPPPTYEMPNDAFFEITGISNRTSTYDRLVPYRCGTSAPQEFLTCNRIRPIYLRRVQIGCCHFTIL